jgi:hypothetical protein
MITKEQIKFKKGKIGASQVAAAIGLSPFQTPANLAMEILGRIPPPEENDFMRIGNIIEPAIAVPVHVVAQVVLQSLLTGINRVEVVAYFGGNDLEIYPLTITPKQQESLLTKVSLFWFDWIEKNEIPPVCDRDIELIKTLYPSADNVEEMTATASVMEDVKNYQEWKTNRNAIDRTIGTYEAKIRLMMGGSSTLKAPDGTRLFTWRQAKPSAKTDWKSVAQCFESQKNYVSEIDKHTKVKEGSRRFLDKHNYEA